MPNTSATGGPLLPAASPPAPLDDATLEDFLHDLVMTLTGIAATNVRPRWQPEPGNIPDFGTDWVALGIVNQTRDTYAAEVHLPSGAQELRRHETLEVLLSFYGPNAASKAAQFSDAMQVGQNREVLQVNKMGLIECGVITNIPELVKERWLRRSDLPLFLRRQIVRNYAVLNLASSMVALNNERYATSINVVP